MAGLGTFGTILRETREQKGVGLDEAARRLRIRPDILRAIEDSDFAHMPPKGYARNMVNAYARYLGLNPTEITTRYLDDLHQYQNSQVRTDFNTGFDMPAQGRRRPRSTEVQDGPQRGRTGYAAARPYESSERTGRRNPPYSEQTGRALYSDRAARQYAGDAYSYRSGVGVETSRGSRRTQRAGGAAGSSFGQQQSYDNLFTESKPRSFLRYLPFVIAVVVVIALLVFIITSVVSCTSKKDDTNVSNIPITGISDTTVNDNTNTVNTTPVVETAPTCVTFQYSVANGAAAYIEVYEDGSETPSTAEEVYGPQTKTYQVTGTLKFVTTSPDSVTLTSDGNKVTPADNADGIYVYNVDFPAALEAWTAEHKTNTNKTTNAAAANAAATTTTSNAAASN
ncbi:MAG: helix-turn-helix transcriptional regulator [Coriobacteriia bacterium]|nr:helix-turn-helix transcriptional regulator [Coriobacteriia bacterium]